MLNLEFKIDENIIARKIISRNHMPVELADYLWGKYNEDYKILQRDFLNSTINNSILKELKQHDCFKEEIEKAKQNLVRIKTNWEEKFAFINNYLKSMLRVDFDLNLTCYIVSPGLNSGINIGNNSFVWGHKKGIDDPNYDLVYLVHESLHSFFDKDNLNHTIIEKIADVELSKFLNKILSGYSTHKFTQEEHIKIFPFWNLYMRRTKKEIEKEQKVFNIKYNIDKFEVYREKLKNLNIFEFIDFLNVEKEKIQYSTQIKLEIVNL